MVFSSIVFLFLFLPIVLVGNFILKGQSRNYFLLLASLTFYTWAEGRLLLLMLVSIGINYLGGIAIQKIRKKGVLALFIILNLSLLLYYKYFNFIVENLQEIGLFKGLANESILLPIGISFFTFQGISYIVDVYRKPKIIEKNPLNVGLYISLFPQLIAGPIIRYEDIAAEIKERTVNLDLIESGILKFIRGFFKKIVIANSAALICDEIMSGTYQDMTTGIAWLGIICYAIQIYFDFSGYSDMAIGLGRMMGFNFKENFKHPYISLSIREFWRRWHISLSTWFRDYVYIPLGGNRKGKIWTLSNLIIVFFITGLWHGASWNFVIWGMVHGLFLILERITNFESRKILKPIKWFYTITIVLLAWVLFRIEDMDQALVYYQSMFGFNHANNFEVYAFLSNYIIIVLILGVLFSAPIREYLVDLFQKKIKSPNLILVSRYLLYLLVFFWGILELSQNQYNPFIYFRF